MKCPSSNESRQSPSGSTSTPQSSSGAVGLAFSSGGGGIGAAGSGTGPAAFEGVGGVAAGLGGMGGVTCGTSALAKVRGTGFSGIEVSSVVFAADPVGSSAEGIVKGTDDAMAGLLGDGDGERGSFRGPAAPNQTAEKAKAAMTPEAARTNPRRPLQSGIGSIARGATGVGVFPISGSADCRRAASRRSIALSSSTTACADSGRTSGDFSSSRITRALSSSGISGLSSRGGTGVWDARAVSTDRIVLPWKGSWPLQSR